MKRILMLAAPALIMVFGAFLLSVGSPVVSAQILVDTEKPGGLQEMTETTARNANFGTVPIGQVVATVIRAVLSFLGITFIILMVTAGWRWMTAQGDAEAITKSKDSIRSALIGLTVVLAAYAITYFVFRMLPFGGTGGSLPTPHT